jgi:RES domain-containing protein
MADLWRLYRERFGAGLDGIGGTFADGRWHARGERVVYFGASAAIVVLERLAHTDADLFPSDLRLARFTFSGKVSQTSVERFAKLPSGWTNDENATRGIGTEWRRAGVTCLLVVPSAILPEEFNLVLNPQHPDAKSLRLASERPFTFDARLI